MQECIVNNCEPRQDSGRVNIILIIISRISSSSKLSETRSGSNNDHRGEKSSSTATSRAQRLRARCARSLVALLVALACTVACRVRPMAAQQHQINLKLPSATEIARKLRPFHELYPDAYADPVSAKSCSILTHHRKATLLCKTSQSSY